MDTTTSQVNDQRKTFHEEVERYISCLHERFKNKCVIKRNTYDDILKALPLAKGKSANLPPKFVYWAKRKFTLMKIAGVPVVSSQDSKMPVCVYETYYDAIFEAHVAVSHGGRHKTVAELTARSSWIPRFAVEIFLKQCVPCQIRKPLKQPVVSKPIISLGVMTRLQIDLIDMRTRPDQINDHLTYNWILHCIDHYSKFCWAFPLEGKSANGVALKLRHLFFVFGPPRLLHSDNGREFVASVITELKELFPDMAFVHGRPRHPQSQGCIERANFVLCNALGKWLSTTSSSHWSEGLLPVVYGVNTRISSVTKKSPYEVMFG